MADPLVYTEMTEVRFLLRPLIKTKNIKNEFYYRGSEEFDSIGID